MEIGGAGALGLAFETVKGTFVAPTKWIPIRSESLQKVEDKNYRMNIRQLADRTRGPQGNYHIEGDVEFEVTRENLLYFLYAGRYTITKAGASSPFTYTFTPAATANPTTGAGPTARKTLSIVVDRSGQGFGYTGLSMNGLSITFDNEIMIATVSLLGLDESDQSIGSPTWATSSVYGPEDVAVEIPAATGRADVQTATISIDEGGSAEHRMDGSRAPALVRWGEREVTFSCEHDFESKTDYDAFIAQTQQNILVEGERSAVNDRVAFTLKGTIADSYDVSLPGLGDIVTASIEYHAVYEGAEAYQAEVITTEDIT